MKTAGTDRPAAAANDGAAVGPAGADEFSLGALDATLNFRLRRIRGHLTDAYRRETARLGLRPGAFSLLALIEANGLVSQADLARFAGYDPAAVVGIMDDFEKRGWAERRKDPGDRRRHRLKITVAGREALSGLLDHALENERVAREVLTEDELTQFRTSLDKIYRRLV
jgi:DNA-binding MarR family transcriptional regulator